MPAVVLLSGCRASGGPAVAVPLLFSVSSLLRLFSPVHFPPELPRRQGPWSAPEPRPRLLALPSCLPSSLFQVRTHLVQTRSGSERRSDDRTDLGPGRAPRARAVNAYGIWSKVGLRNFSSSESLALRRWRSRGTVSRVILGTIRHRHPKMKRENRPWGKNSRNGPTSCRECRKPGAIWGTPSAPPSEEKTHTTFTTAG